MDKYGRYTKTKRSINKWKSNVIFRGRIFVWK